MAMGNWNIESIHIVQIGYSTWLFFSYVVENGLWCQSFLASFLRSASKADERYNLFMFWKGETMDQSNLKLWLSCFCLARQKSQWKTKVFFYGTGTIVLLLFQEEKKWWLNSSSWKWSKRGGDWFAISHQLNSDKKEFSIFIIGPKNFNARRCRLQDWLSKTNVIWCHPIKCRIDAPLLDILYWCLPTWYGSYPPSDGIQLEVLTFMQEDTLLLQNKQTNNRPTQITIL